MSEPNRHDGSDERCELEPVTCWPLLYGAAGVVVLGVLVSLGLFLTDSLRPPRGVAEVPAPQAAAPEQEVAPIDRGADVAVPVRPSDERVVSVKRQTVREYVPLPPAPSKKQEAWAAASVSTARLKRKPGRGLTVPSIYRPYTPDESMLRQGLARQARELDLETEKGAGKKLLEAGKQHFTQLKAASEGERETLSFSSPLETLLKARDDLRGLPLLAGKACQTGTTQARILGAVSVEVRRLQSTTDRRSTPRTSQALPSHHTHLEYVDPHLKEYLTKTPARKGDTSLYVRPLEQMYQTETAGMRVELVKTLGQIKGEEATRALARRAVFDLAPEVRLAAIGQLKGRGPGEARAVFLAALRHPWEPAAVHAAVALGELDDDQAAPSLHKVLNLPEPGTPYKNPDGFWVREELVRVNHLRNCLLCHAPSVDEKDEVRGPIPTPGEPLPVVYYGRSRTRDTLPMVRADVVYFRQDFSTMHAVKEPNKWPEVQRFDYLVQTRELTAKEAREALEQAPDRAASTRRDAIRWALAKLQKERIQPEE